MEKEVKIKVKSNQNISRGQNDQIEVEETGSFYKKNDIYYLVYNNYAEGINGARTIVKIDPEQEQISILRSKPARMEQKFIEGEVLSGSYHTKYGKLNIENETEILEYDLNENEGTINLVYDLYINNKKYTKNTLNISYTDISS